MSDLTTAVAMFLSTLHDPESGFEEAHNKRVEVHEASVAADPEDLAAAVAQIAESLRDGELGPGPGGMAAITGGALVEGGAPARALGEAILASLGPHLVQSRAFQDACLAKLPAEPDEQETDEEETGRESSGQDEETHLHEQGEDSDPAHEAHAHDHEHGEGCDHGHEEQSYTMRDREVPLSLVEEIATENMLGAMCFESMEDWCLPAIACLTKDPELRAAVRANEDLYVQVHAALGYEGFLTMVLDVLDDEPLLVLHPSTGQGYRLRISGVADNFQLHLLLADALIPADGAAWGLPGERPAEEALAAVRGEGEQQGGSVVGLWNVYTWRAISPEGKLVKLVPSEHWVWNEGRPADIEPFRAAGEKPLRVVVLGPPAYERSWAAQRIFGGLIPSVDVEVLEADEVARWLQRLAKGEEATSSSE